MQSVWQLAKRSGSRPGRSLRVPILLLIVLAVGPLLGARFWQISHEAERAIETAEDQAHAVADLAARQHDEIISKTRTFLEVLVRVPAVRQGLVDQCHMLLRDLARNAPWQRRVWVIRPDGRAACASHSARAELNVADRDYFQRALATRRFVVSDYVRTRVQNEPAIIAALPALDEDGNVEAVALVTLNVGASEHPLRALDQSSHAILMVDSGNVVVAWRAGASAEAAQVVGTKLAEGPLSALLADRSLQRDGPERHVEAVGPDGVLRIWGVVPLSQPAGGVAVGISKADVIADARASAIKSVAITLAVGALAGFAVWLGADRLLLRNIRALAAAASEIGGGNLTVRPCLPASAGEFHIVAHALNEMAARLRQREAELQASKLTLAEKTEDLQVTLEHIDQGLMMVDKTARVRVCNRRAMDLLGLPEALMLSRPTFSEVAEYQLAAGEFGSAAQDFGACIPGDGSEGAVQVHERQRPNGAVLEIRTTPLPAGGAVRTYTDVTERKATEIRILHTARHDALTDLPNRLLFRERLQEALGASQRSDEAFAVLWLDLDRFKAVNDGLGHAVGDALLVAVADRIRGVLRQGDVVARLGGDEFAILQLANDQPVAASALAERVVRELSRPFHLQDHQIHIGASVGIAVWPSDGRDADGLLKNADLALYRAKADGRGVFRFFEPDMDAQVKARRTLELELRKALAESQFELHYQPLVETRTRTVIGFEALVRWQHPTRGLIGPGEFVPLAEETQLILQLGDWVLRDACREAASWPRELAVAVNISAAQFATGDVVASVREALKQSGLDPARLQLEITETVLMGDPDMSLRLFRELRGMGVRIALDDFGTGYSSLSYLRSFPFDKLKIDRSFVRELADSPRSIAFIRTIVSLGASLGIPVCAEGIETESQYEAIRAVGCGEAQGFLISRPKPAREALRAVEGLAPRAA